MCTSQNIFLFQSTELKTFTAEEQRGQLYSNSPSLGLLVCFFEQENIASFFWKGPGIPFQLGQ